ncbi:MAG: MBL fold metallo-hydrolase, partial [Candidatus Helarchaeota archaeon]|nr:MBL fold metallo-hydrolase [Candidatus Helarchaeota archaeon]
MNEFKSELSNIEGVYRFKIDVPYDVKFVCAYLFKLGDKNILFDAGLDFGNWSKSFFSLLEDTGISIKEIDYCIVSHHHVDHIGLLKKFKRENPNLQILMNEITNNVLKWENDVRKSKEIEEEAKELIKKMKSFGLSEINGRKMVRWFKMWPNLRKYHEPDKLLHDKDEIIFGTSKIEIIWTPGHSLGHICVFDHTNKHLFSGDHILSGIT